MKYTRSNFKKFFGKPFGYGMRDNKGRFVLAVYGNSYSAELEGQSASFCVDPMTHIPELYNNYIRIDWKYERIIPGVHTSIYNEKDIVQPITI